MARHHFEYAQCATVSLLHRAVREPVFIFSYLALIYPIKLAGMVVIFDDQRSCVAEICSRTSFDATLEPVDLNAFIPGPDIYTLIKARDNVAVEFPGGQTKRLEIRASENLQAVSVWPASVKPG
jgi:hypothetical protein